MGDVRATGPPAVKLGLFVTGATPRSRRALTNLRRFCDENLAERYELEVVDLYRTPERAREAQIVAAPSLVRYLPEPRRIAIGDLSDTKALESFLLVS